MSGPGFGAPFDDADASLIKARIAEAADERRRTRFLSTQAAEDASFVGVIHNLAERGDIVVVETCAGMRHRAHIRAVGADFVVLHDGQSETVVRIGAITTLDVGETRTVVGDGAIPLEVSLAEVLADMAANGAPVQLRTASGRTVRGVMRMVGRDVVCVRSEAHHLVYAPLEALAEVTVSGGDPHESAGRGTGSG